MPKPTTFWGGWFAWFVSKMDRRPPPPYETKYYESFGGLNHPWRPMGQCDEEEAKAAHTYVKADYKDGQLVRLERFLDGETFWLCEYTYQGRKLVHIRTTNADGQVFEIDE